MKSLHSTLLKIYTEGTKKQTHKHTDRHCNLWTESAYWPTKKNKIKKIETQKSNDLGTNPTFYTFTLQIL